MCLWGGLGRWVELQQLMRQMVVIWFWWARQRCWSSGLNDRDKEKRSSSRSAVWFRKQIIAISRANRLASWEMLHKRERDNLPRELNWPAAPFNSAAPPPHRISHGIRPHVTVCITAVHAYNNDLCWSVNAVSPPNWGWPFPWSLSALGVGQLSAGMRPKVATQHIAARSPNEMHAIDLPARHLSNAVCCMTHQSILQARFRMLRAAGLCSSRRRYGPDKAQYYYDETLH